MASIIIDLHISAEEYIKRYRLPGATVYTRCRLGRSVRFPANILQPFVTHSGISGSFRIDFDAQGRFHAIERL